ncbi:ABC transporter ATP-binding protein [Nesterenkonia sp. CF4.4]|uniref:ABC transporter ATP-binding protein n=1 Tax=Nesterenkonia sp. CF4.4 TaxID=3373079 RepID=UPI003EE56E58
MKQSTAAASLRGVTRRFGSVTALEDVTLDLQPGELVGMLGPNGAGKSTLLQLISGIRRPTAGTVELFGEDPRLPRARVQLGTTPQETGLPATLRVREIVDFVAGHYPDPMPRSEVLGRFGIADLQRRQIGGLSGGQKRRLAVALSLVGRPRLVLLDEPTTGLDVDARHVLWDAVREYHDSGACLVVTSHYLEEIQALAERVIVIDSGRVLADENLESVLAKVDVRQVRLRLDRADPSAAAALERLDGVLSVEHGDLSTLVTRDADATVRALVHARIPFAGLEVRGASLEDAFLTLTRANLGSTQPSGVSS